MTNLKAKITTAVATAGLLATSFAPAALAATDITVSGNGADSTNKVKVKSSHVMKVKQMNVTSVGNNVVIGQNTGGNTASKNTGGNVSIDTGKAEATVTNNTTTGGNSAVVNGCGCPDSDLTIDVKNNGADSTNKVKVSNKHKVKATQKNTTMVVNGVVVGQDTGNNTADKNTGGDVEVTTGDADATVTNTTTVGVNTLSL